MGLERILWVDASVSSVTEPAKRPDHHPGMRKPSGLTACLPGPPGPGLRCTFAARLKGRHSPQRVETAEWDVSLFQGCCGGEDLRTARFRTLLHTVHQRCADNGVFGRTKRSRDVRRWALTEPAEKRLSTNSTNDTNECAAAQLASASSATGTDHRAAASDLITVKRRPRGSACIRGLVEPSSA